ncbi:MAG: leucine-rich repeat domain-containing protein [Clostridia bacterium]|nr:leucine-rich repeat domain-containing protein [Clostridia bacterium]
MIETKVFDNRVFLIEDGKALLSTSKEKVVCFDDSITSIGPSFMEGDLSIEGVILHDNIEEVCDNAFLNCANLKFVVLGKRLKCIGQCGFTGNKALRYVIFRGYKEWYLQITKGEPFESVGIIHCADGIVRTINAK